MSATIEEEFAMNSSGIKYFKKAEAHRKAVEYHKAIAQYQKALSYFRRHSDINGVLDCTISLADTYRAKADNTSRIFFIVE